MLLKQGWRPRRTIIFGSWDAEEEGLIGSTEWVEQHAAELQPRSRLLQPGRRRLRPHVQCRRGAVAPPVPARDARGGSARPLAAPCSNAGGCELGERPGKRAVPIGAASRASLESATLAPAPTTRRSSSTPECLRPTSPPTAPSASTTRAFDDFDWFTRFADPEFAYTQQQARLLGIEVLHMADADVLPYDDHIYAQEIQGYLAHLQNDAARHRMEARLRARAGGRS